MTALPRSIIPIAIICLFLTSGSVPEAPAKNSPQPPSLTIDGKSFAGSLFQKGNEIFATLPEFLELSGLTAGELDKLNLPSNAYAVSRRLPHVSVTAVASSLKWTLTKDPDKSSYSLWTRPKEVLDGQCPLTLEETYVETPSRTSRKVSRPVRATIPGPMRVFVKAHNAGKNKVEKAVILCLYLDSEGKELNREEQTLTDIGPAKTKDVIFFWSNPAGLPMVNYKLSVTKWE